MTAKSSQNAPSRSSIGEQARSLATALAARTRARNKVSKSAARRKLFFLSFLSLSSAPELFQRPHKHFLGGAEEELVRATVALLKLTGWNASYRSPRPWERKKAKSVQADWLIIMRPTS